MGLQRADVPHRRLQGSAEKLGRGVRGNDAAGRQVEQGPRAGLRRPDLHRRRRALSDDAQARARHQGPLRADRGPVQGGARTAAWPAQGCAALLARCDGAGRRLHQ